MATEPAGSQGDSGAAGDGSRKTGKRRKPRRAGRLRRLAGHARTLRRDPRAAGPLIRGALLEIWQARGGG
ncbi:MAG: hypothetical protein RIE74_04060, partial [Pseudomonadales bacterium]